MAKSGRKRKFCKREPNGRPQRPTAAAQTEIVRERNDAVMSVVLAQPHRLGSRSQQRESPWGRFCEDHKLRREIYDGGNSYADLLRRWRAAKGVPSDIRIDEGGDGHGPSDATVRGWSDRLASIRLNVVLQTGPGAWLAVEMLLVDRLELPKASIRNGVIGAAALAVEIGAMSSRSSPFGD